MLNVTLISGSNQYAASHYFSASDDYYASDADGNSQWQGKGAEKLGLIGTVDQTQFSRLLAGVLPDGAHIECPGGSDKRMGWDITFSAPKSISMQSLIAEDSQITKAHDEAVAAAMERAEDLAMARKKVMGKSSRERTGNMVIARFRHAVSRDQDPQLHTHAIVLNMTQRADGAWRALSADDLYRVQHEMDALYKLELATRIQALGYGIRMTDNQGNFELAHISRDQIEAFSSRSATIENVLSERGKTRLTATPGEKQSIALATRSRKAKTDIEVVRKQWLERSRGVGINYIPQKISTDTDTGSANNPGEMVLQAEAIEFQNVATDINNPISDQKLHENKAASKGRITPLADGTTTGASEDLAQGVVRYAIRHLTEREASVKESLLVTTALRHAVGLRVSAESVKREIARLEQTGSLIPGKNLYRMAGSNDAPRSAEAWAENLCRTKECDIERARRYVSRSIKAGMLIQSERCFTTPKSLKQERAILAMEREGRGAVVPLMSRQAISSVLAGTTLNEGQHTAVHAIVGTSNRYVGIQGDAGTGKTYAIRQALSLINQAGKYNVLALVPYSNQAKALKQDGLETKTLASYLYSKNKKIDNQTIIVLEEAAVVGSRQMVELMRSVENAGARLVMLGDTKQTEAIEAGKPFAQLQQAGMETARVSEILRQKNPTLKRAVENVAAGEVKKSVQDIAVVEIKDSAKRHQTMVNDLMQMTPEERQQTLVIAGTNDARKEINQMIRAALHLEGQGREYKTLNRVDMTQEQRRVAASYKEGMVIQPERDYQKAGLERWQNYEVLKKLPGNLLEIKAEKDGAILTINPRKITKLSVYNIERTEMAVGDTVRITRNDTGKDLTNGDKMRVVGVSPGLLTVERVGGTDKQPIDLDARFPLHLAHAYSSTVHSSQGMTSGNVLISLDVHSRTTSRNLYYVAISRAQHQAKIYTNSANQLPDSVSRLFTKTTALSTAERFAKQQKALGNNKAISTGRQLSR